MIVPSHTTAAMALVSGVSVHQNPFRRVPASPWCYSADAFSFCNEDQSTGSASCSTTRSSLSPNFLSTQVWPSARMAAVQLEENADPSWTICELGCGPALPSIVAASKIRYSPPTIQDSGTNGDGLSSILEKRGKVIATDYDQLALQLVEAATNEQNLDVIISTQLFDLTEKDELPEADLYVLSDVFECAEVALGAAYHTVQALGKGKKVWVFAQSDRSQREIYRHHLKEILLLKSEEGNMTWDSCTLNWTSRSDFRSQLVLFDVDETNVEYC